MSSLPEIIFSSSDSATSQQLSKLLKAGTIRKLIPRVYTSNLVDEDTTIIKRNLWMLVSHLFPEAQLSHRSALEFSLSPKNRLYLSGNNKKTYKWGAIEIRMVLRPKKLTDDHPIFDQLYVSSFERALLENLLPSRTIKGEKRTLDQHQLEDRLLQELNTRGEDSLNYTRDRAREIAQELGWELAFQKLHKIIGSLLSSKPKDILKSPIAIAKVLGEPYDAHRIDLFQNLVASLKQTSFPDRPQKTKKQESFELIAFFESYFSNYIEGTTFEIQEAKDIVYNGMLIPNRTGDTHDIKGTFSLVANRFEMSKIPESYEELIQVLQDRHRQILYGRQEKNPGIFKSIANRAGSSHFVEPNLVRGTLKHGFELFKGLTNTTERALYMMFLISEIHPFDDGNGRLARVMMNAELVHGCQSKLIIPTVYRDDYILNLKQLTRHKNTTNYIRMMDRAHTFSHWLIPDSYDNLVEQLELSNAFKESDEAALLFN